MINKCINQNKKNEDNAYLTQVTAYDVHKSVKKRPKLKTPKKISVKIKPPPR